ncbi:7707_t:CDS:2 [Paraglomus occultum]|uniref:7707_t:CDS:1 n=1 Tax=Paraglomus occultum TaxID=144539 RepID=A0A9N9CCJ4_9GLOM|nr:7707_t:CDS:2 [Paraglomus occultum]
MSYLRSSLRGVKIPGYVQHARYCFVSQYRGAHSFNSGSQLASVNDTQEQPPIGGKWARPPNLNTRKKPRIDLLASDDPVRNAQRIEILAEGNLLEDAIKFVKDTPPSKLSVPVWNTLIKELCKRKRIRKAYKTYIEMKRRGFQPNVYTFTTLLNGMAEGNITDNSINNAKALVESMDLSSEIKVNPIHGNALLKVCSRADDLQSLKQAYDTFFQRGRLVPNNETYTTIINSCARHEREGFEFAWKLWEEILDVVAEQKNTTNDGYKYSTSRYDSNYNKSELVVDDLLVCAMIHACKNADETEKGLRIVQQAYGIGNNSVEQIFHLQMSPKSLDGALGLCIRSRAHQLGVEIFDKAITKFPEMKIDIYNFNSLMKIYIEANKCRNAIDVMSTIRARNLVPVRATYDLALTACRILDEWGTGKKFFEELRAQQIAPDEHMLNMILGLALGNKLGDARRVFWLLEQFEVLFNETEPELKNVNFVKSLLKAYEVASEHSRKAQEFERWNKRRIYLKKHLQQFLPETSAEHDARKRHSNKEWRYNNKVSEKFR